MTPRLRTITRTQVATFLDPRPRDSHKGMFGTVVVIGGARGMAGAPLIAARAALKLGAGAVHAGLLAEDAPAVDTTQPELMVHSARDALHLAMAPGGRDASSPRPLRRVVLAIGCGMGTSPVAQALLAEALQAEMPLVVDADALTLVAAHASLEAALRARTAPSIVTPHPGEAGRLLGLTTEGVQAARVESAQRLAGRLRCAVVLKGAGSVCVTADGVTYLNTTGNPGMSSAGMGDALTGMIAAFLAQGVGADHALLLGVHLHGAAADALAEQGITVGMTATEIIERSRSLLNQWI